jgi:hypothetical protein
MATKKMDLIQTWLGGASGGGFGPALSEFDATGVPAPVASSVEGCSHLANHQASASHNGITFSSAFLDPRTNAVATEHAIPRLPSLFTLINDPAPECIPRRDLVGAL